MNRTKSYVFLCVLLVLALGFTGCGGSKTIDTATDKQPVITASLGSVAAETSNQITAAKMFSDKVKEYTGGTVIIKVFPAGQIGSDESMAEDLSRGNLEFSFLNQGSCAGFDKMLDIHYLPYIARNYEEADQLFYGDGVIPTSLKKTLKSHGITVLGWYENEFRGLSNSVKEVKIAADLKNMKLRVPGSAAIKGFFAEAGAQPVIIAFPELYTALQQGTVDGQDNGILITHDNRLEEKNKYYTYLKHVYAMSSISVSDVAWNKFNKSQQEAILKAAGEAQKWQVNANREQIDGYIEKMKASGVNFYELSNSDIATFNEVADRTWDKMKAVYGEELINELKVEVDKVRGE